MMMNHSLYCLFICLSTFYICGIAIVSGFPVNTSQSVSKRGHNQILRTTLGENKSIGFRLSTLFAADNQDGVYDGPKVSITYCTGCRWMLRAAWLAQELLTTFQDDLRGVELIPSRPPSPGGIFKVEIDGRIIWDRKEEGRFPEAKELKQKVRNIIDPTRDLGHSDVKNKQTTNKCEDCPPDDESMDDDEAEEARRYFGVA